MPLLDLRVDEHPEPVAELAAGSPHRASAADAVRGGMPRRRRPAVAAARRGGRDAAGVRRRRGARRAAGSTRATSYERSRSATGYPRHRPAARAPGARIWPRSRDILGRSASCASSISPTSTRPSSSIRPRPYRPGSRAREPPALGAADRGAGARASAPEGLSPRRATQACLDRIAALDRPAAKLHLPRAPTRSSRRARAERGDRARATGAGRCTASRSAVKDNYLTADMPTHRGHRRRPASRSRAATPRRSRGCARRARC